MLDLLFGVEGANHLVDWQPGLVDGGALSRQTLQTYSTSTIIEGLRHGPADGGTLVVDFGDIGERQGCCRVVQLIATLRVGAVRKRTGPRWTAGAGDQFRV